MYCGALVILICALVFDCNALISCKPFLKPYIERLNSVMLGCVPKIGGWLEYENKAAAKDGNRRRDNNIKRSDGSPMGEEFPSVTIQGYPHFNTHPSNASSPRRNRRRRQVQSRDAHRNSGDRSQYNPNTPELLRSMGDAIGMNLSTVKNKYCLVACIFEDLNMTGENGIADRDVMLNVLKSTKDEKMRNLFQEPIEECFKLPVPPDKNKNDKCEFAEHIIPCLMQKSILDKCAIESWD